MNELQAITQAKELIKKVSGQNWTITYMQDKEADKFIWSYLFDNGLQYLNPIKYNNNQVALVHQEF